MNMINFAREFDARLSSGEMANEGRIFKTSGGYLIGWGVVLPTGETQSSYSDGAIYIKTDGNSLDTIWYVKVGGSFQAAQLSGA